MTGKKLIVGNWKMNGFVADSMDRVAGLLGQAPASATMVICPPATLLAKIADKLKGSAIGLGAQDCHTQPSGAYTGDISASMLKDIGCGFVIVGHSERRQYHNEPSPLIAEKAAAAHAAGLVAIICVGETDAERTDGRANAIVSEQLSISIPKGATPENTVIAYEPVWAIGTGKTASADDIVKMHAHIRAAVGDLKILYGGSVKGANADEILHTPNVDGVLVGGASLKVDDFLTIAKAA